jgi:hypothetical protein
MYFEIMWLHMPTKVLIPLKRVLKKSTGFFLPFTGVSTLHLNFCHKKQETEECLLKLCW